MIIIVILSLFFNFIASQTTIPLDTVVSRTAPTGSNDVLLFPVSFANPSILIDLLGPSGISTPRARASIIPAIQLIDTASSNNTIASNGNDITMDHAYGIPCPGDVPAGTQQINVIADPPNPIPYGIKVSVTNASLDGNVISELACCKVPVLTFYPIRNYFIDVSPSDTVLRFFVAKTNTQTVTTPVLLVKYTDCIRTLYSPDYTYTYTIAQDNSVGIFEINSASSPPLTSGRYYATVPRSQSELPLTDYSYSLGACLGSGCIVNISVNPINSLGETLTPFVIFPYLIVLYLLF
jgi:WD40 repeat protein